MRCLLVSCQADRRGPQASVIKSIVIDAIQTSDGQQELPPGSVPRQPGMTGQERRAASDLQLMFLRRPARQAIDLDVSMLRRQYTGQHAQQRRLAHAIGPEDGDELAGVNFQSHLPQNRPHAIVLSYIHRADHDRFSMPGRGGKQHVPDGDGNSHQCAASDQTGTNGFLVLHNDAIAT